MPPSLPSITRIDQLLAENSLREFVSQAWPVIEPATLFVPGWHLDALCEHLEAVTAGHIRNLVVSVPPRSSKSSIVSVLWPAWVWARRPATRWLCASYALGLAVRDAVRCRRLIESPWYQQRWGPVFRLTGDQNVKSRYENDRTGQRLSCSVDSGVTGEGGDVLVIDDPHNVVEVDSEATRRATLAWWNEAFSNRLNDPRRGSRVLIGQRVHEGDLIGHVLGQGGFEHLFIPEEFEPERRCVTSLGWQDPRTQPGELMRPERFGPEQVAEAQARLGARAYAAQHQQRPAPAAGALFKRAWLRYYGRRDDQHLVLPDRVVVLAQCRRFLTVDLATSTRTTADYTVVASWADDGQGNLLLLDLVRGRLEAPDIVPAVRQALVRWEAQYAALESGGFQLSIVQQARREGLPVRELKADRDKVTRSTAAQVRMEAGQLWFPRGEPWLAELEAELLQFPSSSHDDMVDAVSFAAEELVRLALVPPIPTIPGDLVLNRPSARQLREETPLQRMLRLEREAEEWDRRPRRRWWG